MNPNSNYILFNISFIDGDYNAAYQRLKKGELMMVPSGPGLATIDKDNKYWQAMKNSDFAIPDSGFMVLLYRLFMGQRIKKLSGAKFIKQFLNEPILTENNKLFMIDPSIEESNINRSYLNNIDIPLIKENQYVAPIYDRKEIIDYKLLKILETQKEKPKFILINLGSGVQERLGSYLKNNLSYTPALICTGAGIAFLTGAQASMPEWVDRMYLGWLSRIVQNPKIFIMRYLKAFRLVYIFYLEKKGLLK